MNSYCAGDGKWLWLIGAEASRHWEPIIKALGADELLDDERFKTARDRRRNATTLVQIFNDIFARHPRDEWAAIFRTHDIWWAPVNSFEDLMSDPQVDAAGAFISMPTRADDGTTQTSIASPVDFGAAPVEPAKAPPAIGADSASLLGALGLGGAEPERPREDGVVV